MSNTESDVFRMGKTGAVYYLVAGRWFSAPDFIGPWTFATPSIPEEFKKIPIEHAGLACWPPCRARSGRRSGPDREDPETARVNKKELKPPDVAFQGAPSSKSPSRGDRRHAVNSDKDIFKVGDSFYMCYQGVWFVGKSTWVPGKWPTRCRRKSTGSRSALQPITSRT